MRGSSSQAPTISPCALALVVLVAPTVCPHGEILDGYSVTWVAIRANDINRASSCSGRTRPFPIIEGQTGKENTIARGLGRLPVAIDVQGVCIAVPYEVFKDAS